MTDDDAVHEFRLRSIEASLSMPDDRRERIRAAMFDAFDDELGVARPGRPLDLVVDDELAARRSRSTLGRRVAIGAGLAAALALLVGVIVRPPSGTDVETLASVPLPGPESAGELLQPGTYRTGLLGEVTFRLDEAMIVTVAVDGHVRLVDPDDPGLVLDLLEGADLGSPLTLDGSTPAFIGVAEWVAESDGFGGQQTVQRADDPSMSVTAWLAPLRSELPCLPRCVVATTTAGEEIAVGPVDRVTVALVERVDGSGEVLAVHQGPQDGPRDTEVPYSALLSSIVIAD